jgi:hypothetical protein
MILHAKAGLVDIEAKIRALEQTNMAIVKFLNECLQFVWELILMSEPH